MGGIAEVARVAGVSKSTASRALTGNGYVSPATRERVARVAEDLGYVASSSASSLATGRTRNIGVVMPYLNRWFFAEVLEGVQEVLLARKRFDGLIAVALEPDDHELERLVGIGRPVVSVVGDSDQTSVVGLDDVHAARRATAHLVDLGHERITFLGGISDHEGPHVDRERLGGYASRMHDAGLRPDHAPSEVSLPGGYDVAVDLLSDPDRRPTAIVAACDEVAIGAIIAARRLGIAVPSALSVVGIDNHEYSEMFGLTTLEQSPRGQGAAAARLLLDHLRSPGTERTQMRLHARLIVRGSTSPPPGTPSVAVGVIP